MPCYDSRSDSNYVRAEAKKEFQADLDKLTRMLCDMCKSTEKRDFPMPTVEIERWWTEHQMLDQMREDKTRG